MHIACEDRVPKTSVQGLGLLNEVLDLAGTGKHMWGFPKIRGTILGVPIIRTIVYWGLHWGTLILGNFHVNMKLLSW